MIWQAKLFKLTIKIISSTIKATSAKGPMTRLSKLIAKTMVLAYLDDRTINTNGQNGVSGQQNSDFRYQNLDNDYRNGVCSDQIINISRRWTLAIVIKAVRWLRPPDCWHQSPEWQLWPPNNQHQLLEWRLWPPNRWPSH